MPTSVVSCLITFTAPKSVAVNVMGYVVASAIVSVSFGRTTNGIVSGDPRRLTPEATPVISNCGAVTVTVMLDGVAFEAVKLHVMESALTQNSSDFAHVAWISTGFRASTVIGSTLVSYVFNISGGFEPHNAKLMTWGLSVSGSCAVPTKDMDTALRGSVTSNGTAKADADTGDTWMHTSVHGAASDVFSDTVKFSDDVAQNVTFAAGNTRRRCTTGKFVAMVSDADTLKPCASPLVMYDRFARHGASPVSVTTLGVALLSVDAQENAAWVSDTHPLLGETETATFSVPCSGRCAIENVTVCTYATPTDRFAGSDVSTNGVSGLTVASKLLVVPTYPGGVVVSTPLNVAAPVPAVVNVAHTTVSDGVTVSVCVAGAKIPVVFGATATTAVFGSTIVPAVTVTHASKFWPR